MSTYAIGDIQGCYSQFLRLLDQLQYDPSADSLWLTGDLVNRGPQSLEVLRFLVQQPNIISILGNHDLALLMLAHAEHPPIINHTLQLILEAPDREPLLQWLRQCPLVHYDQPLNFVMSHAGIPPCWDLATALRLAAEVEALLKSDQFANFMGHLFGDEPTAWSETLTGTNRYRFIINALTRMRFITQDKQLNFQHKGPVGTQPSELVPWFAHPDCLTSTRQIIGHWAALEGKTSNPTVFAIDTGAVWGNKLTALNLDTLARVSV